MSYRVVYDRDETGWWQARVPSVPGCHTQGRTVEEARRRIREALGLFVNDADQAKLVDAVKLPASAGKAIKQYVTLNVRASAWNRRASAAARRVVRMLKGGKLKLSTRDAAAVLGVSHQRVSQLARDRAEDRKHRG
ncbi:MAG: type II toxin-antitoxin system HicB family antitoxin [Vicinamibacterales bacterium]|nr:type II toxin-antitoxin system HicB family antitoxin [Vicinamibacterales bacterium]